MWPPRQIGPWASYEEIFPRNKETAYNALVSLVRPQVEYASLVVSPYAQSNINWKDTEKSMGQKWLSHIVV